MDPVALKNLISARIKNPTFLDQWQSMSFHASVSIVLKCEKNRWSILFIKRTEKDSDPWSGHMAFPGGRMDHDDKDLLETAMRETFEEVGFKLESVSSHVGELNHLQLRKRSEIMDMMVSPQVFVLNQNVDLSLCPNEVAEVHWIPLVHFFNPSNFYKREFSFGSERYVLPCIEFEGRIIWGITYVILSEFLFKIAKGGITLENEKRNLAHWEYYPFYEPPK